MKIIGWIHDHWLEISAVVGVVIPLLPDGAAKTLLARVFFDLRSNKSAGGAQ